MSKIVNLDIHKLDDDLYFLSYTAKWCGPCRQIKPVVAEYLNNTNNANNLILSKEITQEEFQKDVNKYIPFFVVAKNYQDAKNFDTVEKIQTSNTEEFNNFMKKYVPVASLMTIDENF